MLRGGLGVLPQKNLGLNGVKLCNSRHQGGGGCPDHPLLPMLEREACAQFYRDKNMWRNAARDRVLLNHFNNSGVT